MVDDCPLDRRITVRVGVAGGNGFIGTYVCEGLIRRGHVPVVFDHRGRDAGARSELVLGDIRDSTAMVELAALSGTGCGARRRVRPGEHTGRREGGGGSRRPRRHGGRARSRERSRAAVSAMAREALEAARGSLRTGGPVVQRQVHVS
ncbi:NAD-dependent epimerase/dehydratase family protein [Kribbella turkmenica]|uniref:NAD-dependent epimerase/dehydratase family protein n=1 Tax=Kribbella turkmenica TaxID=2530375 RepID=UPI00192D8BE6